MCRSAAWIIVLCAFSACSKDVVRTSGRLPPSPFAEDESPFDSSLQTTKEFFETRGDIGGGVWTSTITTGQDVLRAVVVSTDGSSVFVAGRTKGVGAGADDLFVGKLNYLGNWDTSFSENGWATLDFGSDRDEVAHALAWQTDGKILVGGRGSNGTNSDFAITRFLPNGSLDSSFGVNGIKMHTIGSSNEFIRGLYFQTNGMIVAGGYLDNGSNYNFVSARYFDNGTLDTLFGSGGTSSVDVVTGRDDVATAVTVMSDGRVILAGSTYNASNDWDVALLRYLTNGAADSSFSLDSKVTTTVGAADDVLWAVTLDSNEKVISVGETNNGTNQDFLVMRYMTDGVLDTLFSSDGVVVNTLSSGNDVARGLAQTTDGRFVIGGSVVSSTTDSGFMRFHTNGNTDTTFGTSGGKTYTIGAGEDSTFALAIRSSSQVFAAGRTHNGSNYDLALLRVADSPGTATWRQQAYLKPANAGSISFGTSVAAGDNFVAVGGTGDMSCSTDIINSATAATDTACPDAGAVYIFSRSGSQWSQEAYLKSPNTGSNSKFGHSVAISGNTLVVSAPSEATDGRAYAFVRNGSEWSLQATFSNIGLGADFYGGSTAIDGDTIVLGAYNEDSGVSIVNGSTAATDNTIPNSGAAHVFVRSGSTWTKQALLKANFKSTNDLLGYKVGVAGDTIVATAYGEDSSQTTITSGTTNASDNSLTDSGAAYVFRYSASNWVQEAVIKAPNSDSSDFFGFGGALDENTIVIGAHAEDANDTAIMNGTIASTNNGAVDAGAVYVFSRSGSLWTQQAYIKAPNMGSGDQMGSRLSIEGDTLVASSHAEDSSQAFITNGSTAATDNVSSASGAAYVFVRTGTVWNSQAYLKSNTHTNQWFGTGNAIFGDTIVIGAQQDRGAESGVQNGTSGSTSLTVANRGAAFVFTR